MAAVARGEVRWAKADAYERYLGRWSAKLAPLFVGWLGLEPSARVVDVGCGTGALTRALLAPRQPGRRVIAVDPSPGFLAAARERAADVRASFLAAGAEALPVAPGSVDAVVSGLLLNFLADPVAGLREMARVCRQDGTVAAYVWDYGGEMWMLRHFWEAVFDLVPDARHVDEVRRFADCAPEPLRAVFSAAGFVDIDVTALDATAQFVDFDDYWQPFPAGQGGAPSFFVTLPPSTRAALRDAVRDRLPAPGRSGGFEIGLRAWAVQARLGERATD